MDIVYYYLYFIDEKIWPFLRLHRAKMEIRSYRHSLDLCSSKADPEARIWGQVVYMGRVFVINALPLYSVIKEFLKVFLFQCEPNVQFSQ